MSLKLAVPLAALLATGCASRPFVASLDTGLPPGNATDVAVAADGTFAAAMNGPDRSLSVFALADEGGAVRRGDFERFKASSVDLAKAGVPERVAFGAGIGHGKAIHALVRDEAAATSSVRRVYVSGNAARMSLGTDESVAENPDADALVDYFADANPATEDERLRVREEVRRELALPRAPFAGSDEIVDAVAWNRGERRFVFATVRNGDSVLCFDASSRGEATLLSVLPCGDPRGLAVDAENGILYVADARGARIVAFDLRARRAGLR